MFTQKVIVRRDPAAAVAVFTAAALLLLAVLAGFGGDAVRRVTGIPRNEPLSAPDDIKAAVHEDPMPFLLARDRLEVHVDAPMTVRQLLDNNRLNKPNLQKQVLEQLGNPPLDSTVDAGVTLHLSLTPTAADIPATHSGARP